jgi:CubicO group peptidase (beta-lactamase class C family)
MIRPRLAFALFTLAAAAPPNAKVDGVFARFDKPDSPGCAVAVVQNHRIAYSRGYGRASLELEVPIAPDTVFDIGSTSKQFTAFAVLLLERDGKLSLDDDVRKFVPEIPDYGHRITIRHLLSHTSGLRDYTDLMDLDGHETADHTTELDALEIVSRQRGVNFEPGNEWRYSNTGFFLASIIVKHASGRPLVDFARERIFQPLGMSSTQYLDDTTRIVPRRATAYSPRTGGGFKVNMSDWDQIGDGAVQTTVEDLAKWDENFYAPKVGDTRMLQAMQTTGTLNDGKPHDYGLGLVVDTSGGLRRVQHGGSWAGYRAQLTRFPERQTSVIVLCNVSNAGPDVLAAEVAAAWLGEPGLLPPPRLIRAPETPPRRTPPPDETLRALAGRYSAPDLTQPWTISVVNHELRVKVRKADTEPLTPRGERTFSLHGFRIQFGEDDLTITSRGVEKLRMTKMH